MVAEGIRARALDSPGIAAPTVAHVVGVLGGAEVRGLGRGLVVPGGRVGRDRTRHRGSDDLINRARSYIVVHALRRHDYEVFWW